MAIFQSDVAKGLVSYPVPYAANEVVCLEFDFTFSTTFVAAADKLELGVIPQFSEIVDWTFIPQNLNGNITVGLMSGTFGDPDNARTTGSEFISATAMASAMIRGAAAAPFLLPKSNVLRPIGLTASADITGAANKSIKMLLMVRGANI